MGYISRTPLIWRVWNARVGLGETPIWSAPDGRLHFIDVKSGERLSCHADGRDRHRLRVADELGFLAALPRGRWLLGSGCSLLWQTDAAAAPVERLRVPGDAAKLRLNDSGSDGGATLYTGTMDRRGRDPIGTLYCIDGRLRVEAFDDGYKIPNGFAFDATRRCLYVADSPRQRIHRYAVDAAGRPADRQTFVQWDDPARGYPDGMAVDADGGLWVACYDGGCVRRFDADGRETLTLALPDPKVTACCFGGPDLSTLFVTTAAGIPQQGWRRWFGRRRGGALYGATPDMRGRARAPLDWPAQAA